MIARDDRYQAETFAAESGPDIPRLSDRTLLPLGAQLRSGQVYANQTLGASHFHDDVYEDTGDQDGDYEEQREPRDLLDTGPGRPTFWLNLKTHRYFAIVYVTELEPVRSKSQSILLPSGRPADACTD